MASAILQRIESSATNRNKLRLPPASVSLIRREAKVPTREIRGASCRIRVSQTELDVIRLKAHEANLTVSAYVRLVALVCSQTIPANSSDIPLINPETVLLIDRRTLCMLLGELRRWGTQYNQAVKAINTVAANKMMRPEDAERVVDGVILQLEEIAAMRDALEDGMDHLLSAAVWIG